MSDEKAPVRYFSYTKGCLTGEYGFSAHDAHVSVARKGSYGPQGHGDEHKYRGSWTYEVTFKGELLASGTRLWTREPKSYREICEFIYLAWVAVRDHELSKQEHGG